MDASVFREAVYQIHEQGRARGHYFLRAQDERFVDRHITVGGERLLSFGSCSYLGLEFDERLIEGAVEAARRYRSQTSYSRGYLSCPLYEALEEELFPKLFGAPRVLLLPSTSAAHHVALPALLDERDIAIIDHQVHRSVDDAVTLQCARSTARKEVVKHGELGEVFERVSRLSRLHRRVWVFLDGVYSMYGDHLPEAFLQALLAVAPNVHLYVDDAHGMSWDGLHGRGHFLARFPLCERVVVVTSLAKAFGTGGGVIVSHDSALIELMRLVGGPYSFSGPLRPADLGASVSSAHIHLSGELVALQQRLRERVAQANALCRSLSLPLVIENDTPIFFIALGRAEAVFQMAERLRVRGYHVNVSGFPAVPASRGGLRVAINAVHSASDVAGLFEAIAEELPAVLSSVGVTRTELDEHFRGVLPSFLSGESAHVRSQRALEALSITTSATHQSLEATVQRSIGEIDTQRWDDRLGPLAYIDSASMRAVESVFHEHATLPEYRWRYRYVCIESGGQLLAAAPLTTSILKDDTFMSAEVSAALEELRRQEPYLFSSLALTTGTMASEGLHVYLREGPQREAALLRLIEVAHEEARSQGCRMIVFGDFPDPGPLSALFGAQGFVPMRLLDNHVVHLDWKGEEAFIRSLPSQRKRQQTRAIASQAPRFRREIWTASSEVDGAVLAHLHELYLRIAKKNLRINIFPLPVEIFRAHLSCGSWEFLVLFDRERPSEMPAAFVAGRLAGEDYRWLYCGVDYDGYDLEVTSPYRQLLWEMIRYPAERGSARVHLGMGSDHEKLRFGSVVVPTYAFVRTDDDYQSSKLQAFVEQLSLQHRMKEAKS